MCSHNNLLIRDGPTFAKAIYLETFVELLNPAALLKAVYAAYRRIMDDPEEHEEEYISTETFPSATNDPINRGASFDVYPYTRLITYMNINDLRSNNETFEQITEFPSEYPRERSELIVEECDDNVGTERIYVQNGQRYKPDAYRYPWVVYGDSGSTLRPTKCTSTSHPLTGR